MTGRVGIDLGGLHCIVENKNGVACFQVFGFFFCVCACAFVWKL